MFRLALSPTPPPRTRELNPAAVRVHLLWKKPNNSYVHNCAVCQILFHCWAHFTDTFVFTSLNCLAAPSRLCPSGPAGPNLWGNICCWRAEEHEVQQWRRWVHTAAQLKLEHAVTNRNRNCRCKCKRFLQNVKTKHECTRFTRLSHPGTSMSPFASVNVPLPRDFLIIPASSSDRWVGSDVPSSPICGEILCQCKGTCSLPPCFKSDHFFFICWWCILRH